ncbi:MAG: CxxC-x17-CxxC domain-containing protein [Candidatus Bathyarchaeia archaeon]
MVVVQNCFSVAAFAQYKLKELSSRMSGKEMHKAVCSDCGQECEVPFVPDPSRPVHCRECWMKRRNQRRRY